MPRDLKPIPRNIVQVEQTQFEAYLPSVGKPSSEEGTVFSRNRSKDLSRKNDNVKDISIGLKDIDNAIQYYFDNTIQPSVIQNGTRLKVPVLYGDAEKWKSVQNDGFYRDANGKIMAPLIMYKRNNVEKNRTLGNKLDGNEAHLFNVFETKYNKKNFYNKFDILTNTIPSKQYYVSVVPDYVTITYECILFTNFIEQNNKLIEAIEFASDAYWGDFKRWHFRTKIDTFAVTNIVEQDNDRVAKTNFTMTLNGYLIPDSVNAKAAATNMFYSPSKVVFTFETVNNINALSSSSLNLKPPKSPMGSFTPIDSYNVNVTNITSVDPITLLYLVANKPAYTTSITNNTATFSGTFLTAPSSLPSTSVTNFTFFVNGQFVDTNSIISFIDNGNNTCTLTVNTTTLGYEFEADDEIVALGKFQ